MFGILSIAPPARIHTQWQPFANYLSKQLGQPVTIVVPRGFGKMKAAAAANQVDIFYVNSHVFYRLKQEDKAIGVAQMQNITGKLTSLSELTRDSLVKLQDQQPGRKVKTDITPDLIANGDPALLGILMNNLTGNAWKYTAKTEQPAIEFGTTQVDDETAYYIRDNGVGFDMQYASSLFVPFQRLHKAEAFEGTGIGLATAQRIVHRHHGRIWAEARINEGATFYFTLGSEAADRLQS